MSQLRICHAFGFTLEQIRGFSYADYRLYEAYLQKEPCGPSADAFYFGELMALLGNINRNEESRPEPFTREYFVPWCNRTIPDEFLTDEHRQQIADQNSEQNDKAMKALLGAIAE